MNGRVGFGADRCQTVFVDVEVRSRSMVGRALQIENTAKSRGIDAR